MKKKTAFLLVVLVLIGMLSINAFASTYHTRNYTMHDTVHIGAITYLPSYRVSIYTEYSTGIFQHIIGFSHFRAIPGHTGRGIYQRILSNYQAEVRAVYDNEDGQRYYGQYLIINSEGPY